ncbi:toll/interleukin-1 receptor domain-containing protein [Streptomyces yaizuensis]|uniref:Toll/interleukin-1 receptor domain-containing protein n=1 Tax=Streptomyces yaizuensis TaxID=2989713 RepID=A0ABQ5P057_9ACTN|nr:toll/interleukin-1 receptor domain-containing protein [Streptomyces sp. YSPA8]GLF95973.1 toll/interleukin-1 receptor domain-containing protein [Streptomyces sp. YSPA8]
MNQDEPVGFWSYTRRDDQIERGRIKRLVDLIADEFEIMSGRQLHIFFDKEDISWGEEWRSRVDSAIMGTTFMIAIVTPRFLRSQECRREVITFSSHASSRGLDDLLLPILYSGPSGLLEESQDDEVAALIKRRNYVDWRHLRLEDEGSPEYRRAVHKLAQRLAEILDRSSELEPTTQEEALLIDDQAGIVDRLASMESALPRLAECLTGFGQATSEIGSQMRWATEEVNESDKRNGGFGGRLRVSNELAGRLHEPVQKLAELGERYASELAVVDPGVLTFIKIANGPNLPDADRAPVQEFLRAVVDAAKTSRENVPILMGFASNADSISKYSKEIRPLMKNLVKSVQRFIDGQAIMDEWERLIQEGGDSAATSA